MEILHTIATWIVSGFVTLGLVAPFSLQPQAPVENLPQTATVYPVTPDYQVVEPTVNPNLGSALPQQDALIDTYLASDITKTATTMTLAKGTTRDGATISGYYCFTLDINSSVLEYACGTVAGTAVTALNRGVKASNPNATSSSLAYPHRRFASVQVTDFPFNQLVQRRINGTDAFEAALTFNAINSYASALSFTPASNQLASVLYAEQYANNVIAGGAPTSTYTVGGKVLLASQLQMSSSTDLGISAPLALQAKFATSTCAVATSSIPITNNTGKIASGCIDQTQAYAFTGGVVSTASTTINATTTLAANVATGKGLCLNGVCYTEPSVQGAANSVLVNDGTGKKTWGSVPKLSNVGATGASLSTTGYATSSTQIVIPAGSLTSSSTIEIYGGGSLSTGSGSSASSCTVLVRSSTGVTLASFGLSTALADGSSMSFTYHAFITATSTTASQYTYIAGIGVDAGLGAGSGVSSAIDTLGNSGINFANAVTLTMVIQETVASKSCSIGNVQYIVNL